MAYHKRTKQDHLDFSDPFFKDFCNDFEEESAEQSRETPTLLDVSEYAKPSRASRRLRGKKNVENQQYSKGSTY